MGRPRKNQAKPPSKSPPKFVAVRKSSRQIARKQLKDDKSERRNGESTKVAITSDCSDDSSSRSKDYSSRSKDDSSRSKDDSSRSKDDSSRSKDDSSRSKDDSSRSKDNSLRGKDNSSRGKDNSSRSKDDSSRSKDDSSLSKDDSSLSKDDKKIKKSLKKNKILPKKSTISKRTGIKDNNVANKCKIVAERKNLPSSSPDKDTTESDSQDCQNERTVVLSKKLTADDVRKMVVGADTDDTNSVGNVVDSGGTEQVCWSEDVIEETIICEEMEVEGEANEGNSSRYTLADDGSVVLEEVLVIDERTSCDDKNVVEFTVIRNEEETRSMVESMVVVNEDKNVDTNHYEDTREYRIIEEGVSCLRVNETPTPPIGPNTTINEKTPSDAKPSKKKNSLKSAAVKVYASDDSTEKIVVERKKVGRKKKKKNIVCTAEDDNSKKSIDCEGKNVLEEVSKSLVVSAKEENDSGNTNPTVQPIETKTEMATTITTTTQDDSSTNSSGDIEKSVNSRLSKIDDELRAMMIDENDKKSNSTIEPSEESTSSIFDYPPVTSKETVMIQRALINEDEDSVTTSEKSEQSRSEDNFTVNKSSSPSKIEEQQQQQQQQDDDAKDSTKTALSPRSKANRSNPISTRSSQTLNNSSREKNSSNDPTAIEEISGDSVNDAKVDTEDIKLGINSNSGSNSSSENSNDTSVSVNNCKLPEFTDGKIPTSNNSIVNETEKKIGFRSRSGSTDTTGSESGSNSSAVRRSSRIRTIGLMKQRSRGRGLVTKPNLELSKIVVMQQERDRLMNSVGATTIQELRDTLDSQSETQSDREGSNRMIICGDMQGSSNTGSGNAGYESDSSKPVKVKSRWRRSSELEMGGSGIGGSRLGFGNNSGSAGSGGSGPGSANGSDFGSGPSSCPGSGSSSAAVTPVPNDSDLIKDPNFGSRLSPIARTVGAKIPLPMVLEVKDREMEERLSQFEHLRENAYLTERYTNKETKRMVCDCFLTEEEVERGELGCGEDCLNRLLMIECGSRCVVSDRCTNKRFQNCEYAKCEVFRTEKKGFGLRATSDLLSGEFIMEYVGEVLDAKDFRRRAKDYSKDKNRHYYFMALKSDQIIDATMKGNISRFINHSCDPNAETQKWTVNGELRIGFFNRRFVAAGEEITFDYHFQRYGKEAQKCFCEASNCRGWIGETPDEEKELIEIKEKREKDVVKKKEEKKPADYVEDEDLEEEIDKLCQCGLKNRAHTLNLSRLMVRSREIEHRTRLLKVIQNGEQPCRRLFLDYHGLRLLWSYMMDIADNISDEAQQFRHEILMTLKTLPIPNKTMLMDSKVFSVVQKWSEDRYLSPLRESPIEEQQTVSTKMKMKIEDIEANCDSNEKSNIEKIKDNSAGVVGEKESTLDVKTSDDVKRETSEQPVVSELSTKLLNEWANLKEVFRIPKKERIEQMKEHEREADRGYREDLEKEDRRETTWYDRSRTDRYARADNDKRLDRRRGRESPDSEAYRNKDKRNSDERSNLVTMPRLSKFERRQLFAMKVAKEEEERLRRQQQESWQEHEARCLALGIDPHTTAAVDPQTGYPLFFNPALGQWQPYPLQDGEIAAQCTPMYGTQGISTEISPVISQQAVYGSSFTQSAVTYPGMITHPHAHHHHHHHPQQQQHHHHHHQPHQQQQQQQQQQTQQYPDGNLVQIQNGTTPIVTMPIQSVYVEKPPDIQFPIVESPIEPIVKETSPSPPVIQQSDVPPVDLPPKWKCAKDTRGRLYYYHAKERISQWLPPPPDHIGVQPDSSSSSETSDDSSSSNDDDDDQDEDRGNLPTDDDMDCTIGSEISSINAKHAATNKLDSRGIVGGGPIVHVTEPKKRRDGLVQERIISPRREEDRVDHKKYKDVKDKMRRQKERARLKEHVDKLRKHRRANKSKTHSRHASKVQDATSDITAAAERKIKDTFRINMANVMVHFLNPYRKNDCKQGRITNTEDFKHLARKLTHFVLAKELKHCKSVDELQCNENVKHKAKDFVRKYMNKFGDMYHKSDED